MRGTVGKLPRPRPRTILPSENSPRVAKVVAAVTGCLVKVLITPEASLIRLVAVAIEARYVTMSRWKRLSCIQTESYPSDSALAAVFAASAALKMGLKPRASLIGCFNPSRVIKLPSTQPSPKLDSALPRESLN